MVGYMSGSKAARNTGSLTNRCQGGGNKLSGLAPSVHRLPANLSAYNRAIHTTPTQKAFVLGRTIMGASNPCAKPGCACDRFLDSKDCQNNPNCRKQFPLNQNPANSGVYGNRWARNVGYVASF